MKQAQVQNGFTLIELLITVSMIGILVALSAPSFSVVIENSRRSLVMLDFTTSIMLAQNEAATRRANVTLCASPNSASCSAQGDDDAALEWHRGWILFLDQNANRTVDDTDEIIRVFRQKNDGFLLRGNETLTTGVTFRSDGFPIASGSFVYCDGRESRMLDLNRIGHVRVTSIASGCAEG